ncbi:MFS transporter [Streptomyces sp. 35M1]|uniref:MFS transporter n=1 Tax=Streptomyces sp. 35M1 TaxID=3142978 RepID=UPI0039905945
MPERWIPAAGPARGLAVAQLVNSLGDGAYYVCSALYFSQVVGLSAAQIGLGLTVAWGVGAVAGVPLGNLADRRGPRGTAVALALATAVSVAAFLTVRSFLPFVLAACAYATAQCGLAAARQSLLAGLVLLLRMPLISVAVPLWIAEHTTAPGWTVSALLVLNTGAVMLFQVRTAAAVRDLPSAVRTVRSGGALMLVSCAVFAGSALDAPLWALLTVLLVAAGLQVWGEMRQSAGAWQIGFDLAPAGRQGQYQGFFGAGVPVARMLGPLLLTTLIVTWGPPGWLVLGALFLGAGAALGPAVRRAERGRPTAPVAASVRPSRQP